MSDKLQIVSEYGVLGQLESNNQFSVKPLQWGETFPTYAHFSIKYGLSPVCIVSSGQFYSKEKLIVFVRGNKNGFSSTFPEEQAIEKTLWECAKLSKPSTSAFRVMFNLGASQYHLQSMVWAYVKSQDSFESFIKAPLTIEDKASFILKSLCPKWVAKVPVSEIGAYTTGADTIFMK
jgi:hypothetical protein